MERIWYFKLASVIAMTLASVVCVVGSVADKYHIPFFDRYVNTELQLGLDLSGGVRLVYDVLIDDALRQRRRQSATGLRDLVESDLHVEKAAYRETGDTGFNLLFESQADSAKCDHAFIRDHGWATDRGRSDASEAHFAVAEDTRSTVRAVAQAVKQRVAQRLGLDNLQLELLPERRFALVFGSQADLDRLDDSVVGELDDVTLVGRFRRRIELRLDQEAVDQIIETSVSQAMEVINNRIDEMGLANTTVSASGTNIIIEIPAGTTGAQGEGSGASAFVERTKRVLETTAQLSFQIADDRETKVYQALRPLVERDDRVEMVDESGSFFLRASDTKQADGSVLSGDKILASLIERAMEKGVEIPDSREFLFEEIPQRRGKASKSSKTSVERVWRSYYLDTKADVTGEHIADARVAIEQQGPESGLPYVALTFNEQGSKLFGQVTKANVNKRMAIVLDDRVNSAPVIQEAILGGTARITLGSFGDHQQLVQDAHDLVVVLRAGGLPAPITLINEEEIGPQLGEDSIRQGMISIIVGGVLVVLFMIIVYNLSGVIANLALMINVLMIFAALGALGATLTLPGLAGIVLTIGMAVDANIIINERIREELRSGKSPRAATDAGYERAFWTIFDAQFTTLIAGVVLYDQGTGPIKGFAVTLLIGVITSMITSIYFTRVAFDWWTKRRRLERLSI
jgi:preprotein translocase subunit SecD